MLSVLCILLGSFQFAFLLVVTGLLLSLAIVSRLMEVVVTLVHPTTVFLLRQSVKLFVLLTTLAAKTAGYALSKVIEKLRKIAYPGGDSYMNTPVLPTDPNYDVVLPATDSPPTPKLASEAELETTETEETTETTETTETRQEQ